MNNCTATVYYIFLILRLYLGGVCFPCSLDNVTFRNTTLCQWKISYLEKFSKNKSFKGSNWHWRLHRPHQRHSLRISWSNIMSTFSILKDANKCGGQFICTVIIQVQSIVLQKAKTMNTFINKSMRSVFVENLLYFGYTKHVHVFYIFTVSV